MEDLNKFDLIHVPAGTQQRRNYVDATSWRRIDVDTTVFRRHVYAGVVPTRISGTMNWYAEIIWKLHVFMNLYTTMYLSSNPCPTDFIE